MESQITPPTNLSANELIAVRKGASDSYLLAPSWAICDWFYHNVREAYKGSYVKKVLLDVHRGSYRQPVKYLAHHTKIITSTMPHPTTQSSAAAPAVLPAAAPPPSPGGETSSMTNRRPGNAAAPARVATGMDSGVLTQVRTQTPPTSSRTRRQALPRAPSASPWRSSRVSSRHLRAGHPAPGRPAGRRRRPEAGDLR